MNKACSIAVFSLLIAVNADLFAGVSGGFIERRRMDRIEIADNRFNAPERVTLNVQYRVPVVETLGYLAAFYPDSQKLMTISQKLRPIANRVEELSGDSFEGRTFPADVDAECKQLRQQMMADVKAVYGQEAVTRIESYIERKYGSLSTGLFGDL